MSQYVQMFSIPLAGAKLQLWVPLRWWDRVPLRIRRRWSQRRWAR